MMEDRGLVSIIMLSHNRGLYIVESVRSILAQTYTNWELLLVDDASDDDTIERLMALKDKLDKMALRPINVLFLDDNLSNLGEARHYLPDIQTGGPELIPELIRQVVSLEKKDLQHKRLQRV